MEDLFEKKYQGLNLQQKEAVDSTEGPVMVVAGPGTGKTQILTLRIANILKKTDIPPENILAITFTESGVASMRKRLVEIIGTRAYRVAINTFHGFCNETIKNYPEEFPRIIGSRQITEIDQISIIEELIDKLSLDILRPFGDHYFYTRSILSTINELKREGLSPEDFEKIVKEEESNFSKIPDLYYEKGAHKGKMKGSYKDLERQIKKNSELSSIYSAYEEELTLKKVYDFNDMIMEVLKNLRKNPDLLLSLQESYQYVLVDEHQDTNNAQNRIIELLMNYHENPNIFIVGDEKQAIFRFQGASLENFFYFKDLYSRAKLVNLVENYRSTQTILDSAHNLLKSELALKANVSHEDKKVHIAAFSKSENENYFLAEDIRLKLDSGAPKEEIVILYRDNKDAFPISDMLSKFGIPYIIESDQDLFTDPDIRKIVTLLRAINYYGEDEYLAAALHLENFSINPLDTYKLLRFSHENKIRLFDLVERRDMLEKTGISKFDSILKFSKSLAEWSSFSKNENLLTVFEKIFEESGILRSILSKKNLRERLEIINTFFDQMKGLVESNPKAMLADFFKHLDTIEKHGLFIKKRKGSTLKGRVRLMTVHRSKGLEFEHVYITRAFDGHFGNRRTIEYLPLLSKVYSLKADRSSASADDNADERRLFYVALTRAKKGVTITYSKEGDGGKEQLPSQFIAEIDKGFIEDLNVSSFEKDFEDKKHILFQSASNKHYEPIDQEFVKNILEKNGLSVTALNNYLDCPWNYFYSNLVRLPKAQDKNAMYGTAVHNALNDFFSKLKDRDLSCDNLIDSFEFYLNKLPLKDKDFKEVLEKGKKALSGYYEKYYSSWERNVLTEFDIKGVVYPELSRGDIGVPVRLTGKLDKIEFLGRGNEVNVVDYKTRKPLSRNQIEGNTKNADGRYKRQLVFYKILLDHYDNGKYKMISSELDFIEPTEKGEYKQEKFFIEDEEIIELKQVIQRVADEILNLTFWDKSCGDKNCQYCDLRKLTLND